MMRPVVGTELTAMLDNPDGDVTGMIWRWAKTVDYAAPVATFVPLRG